jgi:hypothetical protein
MDANLRAFVRSRAAACCEYCRLPEVAHELAFHVEHVTAKQHGGGDEPDNLALACDRCNLYKGPNLSAVDPADGKVVSLFHPRRDRWEEHFRRRGAYIDGVTAVGRATVRLLQMNAPPRLRAREQLGHDSL